jgi:hypothetical protein
VQRLIYTSDPGLAFSLGDAISSEKILSLQIVTAGAATSIYCFLTWVRNTLMGLKMSILDTYEWK